MDREEDMDNRRIVQWGIVKLENVQRWRMEKLHLKRL